MKSYNSIINTSIGNILEWYDFGLFSIFAPTFSKLFFSMESRSEAILTTFSIFAVGFLFRPLGALLFGYLGDKVGRAKTLRLSILMISLPTLFIAFLPTYQQIGSFAPLLLLFIRMWQGVSIGGEYSGSLVYLAESAPQQNRALVTSFASMGANIGILLAAIVGAVFTFLLNQAEMLSWGWRVPYLISGILSLLIYFYRLRLQETPIFNYIKEKNLVSKNPIIQVFSANRIDLLRSFGMVCMGCTFYYFIFTYLPVFITQSNKLTLSQVTTMMVICTSAMVCIIPLAGYICDVIGRRKLLLINGSLITFLIVPGFYFLSLTSSANLFWIFFIFTTLSSFEQGTTTISVIENFPAVGRYVGVAIAYNVANGFLGGTVPFICEWLAIHTHFLFPAIYIELFAIITLVVIYFFVPETRYKKLYT